jgi:integrase
MPSVWLSKRKNKNGNNWLVCWQIYSRGLRITGSESCGPSKRHAETRRQEILEDLYAGKLQIKPKVKLITVSEFAAEYLRNAEKTKARNTYENFDRPAVQAFAAWFGRKPLGMVEAETLSKWRDALLKDGFKTNTVRMWLRTLSSAFGYAVEKRYVTENPFKGVRQSTLYPKAVDVARYITEDEARELIPNLPLNVARAVYFLLNTGLRHGELLSLDWKVVHQKGLWTMEVCSKTGKPRIVEIPDSAREVIGEPSASGKVFPWETRDVIDSALRKASKALGMGRVRAHDCRHTWATNFMKRTGNVFDLMRQGGWSSMTSAAVYQHIRKQDEPVEFRPFTAYLQTNRGIEEAGDMLKVIDL